MATICQREARAFVTLDLDVADMRTYPPAHDAGMVVLRLLHQDKSHVLEVGARVIPLLSQEPLARRLWIVEEHRIRIRDKLCVRALPGRRVSWSNKAVELTDKKRDAFYQSAHRQRVCQAWPRTSQVQVLMPGIRGAEG